MVVVEVNRRVDGPLAYFYYSEVSHVRKILSISFTADVLQLIPKGFYHMTKSLSIFSFE